MSQFKKEMIAMILAGGQGSRLKALTQHVAKPAVPFGGKYRIIDFTLSNCTNSGIDTVGVLTQYQPYVLNNHIGIGSPWDLDRQHGGVKILPPYMTVNGGRWYKGTANAIYENIHFIDMYNPEYVLILSGDHIYGMDYGKMLKQHVNMAADLTIAVKPIPIEEASRFGILTADDTDTIIDFEEKPPVPKSNLASMGIYIFKWSVLRTQLIQDENNPESDNDFGKNIIPKMVHGNFTVAAYRFDGYWKDVGTVNSLWEANMDLLREDTPFDIYDKKWRYYSPSTISPAQYIGPHAIVHDTLVNDGCMIEGSVNNCVLSPKVKIGRDSVVQSSVLMEGVEIGEKVTLENAIVMENVVIKSGKVIKGTREEILVVES
ncbi:MAG: glucose-1-phosphate adenylyltransferase [Clostridia bacterium]|nr:glucose-1-phosphate adenylyltransferase [Clostridia bacterium]